MVIPIELGTQDIRQSPQFYDRDDLGQVIIAGINRGISKTLGAAVVQPQFDPCETLPLLHEAADSTAAHVLADQYAFETQHAHSKKPVAKLIGELALSASDVSEMRPDETFMGSLHQQIDEQGAGLEVIKYWHDRWPSTAFAYLTAIHDIAAENAPGANDRTYEVVKAMTGDIQNLTLAPDNSDALMLLTYLPHRARQLSRGLLMGNHIVARMDHILGDSKTSEEAEMLQLILSSYQTEALSGYQWHEGVTLAEATQIQVAKHSAEHVETLARIQRYVDNGSGRRVVEAWSTVTADLNDQMDRVSESDAGEQWRQKDRGHCFQNFKTLDLTKAFRLDVYGMYPELGDFQQEKKGQTAVILEDDAEQRRTWVEAVDRYSPFAANEALAFASPSDMEGIVEDPNVGLFLLDIQNGQDETAGIRMAAQVLQRRFELNNESEAQSYPTKIVVWSASAEALKHAERELIPLIESLREINPMISYRTVEGGGPSSSSNPISLNIRPKNLNTWLT